MYWNDNVTNKINMIIYTILTKEKTEGLRFFEIQFCNGFHFTNRHVSFLFRFLPSKQGNFRFNQYITISYNYQRYVF